MKRLNSTSFPRFRSHPIHLSSPGFQSRGRKRRKKGPPSGVPYVRFSRSIPSAATSRTAWSPGIPAASASVKSPRIPKCSDGSWFARNWISRCSTASRTAPGPSRRVGTTTAVRREGGIPPSRTRSSSGRRRGGRKVVTTWFIARTAMSLAGINATRKVRIPHPPDPTSQGRRARTAAVAMRRPPPRTMSGWVRTQRWKASRGEGR